MVDQPESQSQGPLSIDLEEGNVIAYGVNRETTSNTLATIALGLLAFDLAGEFRQ